MTDPTTFKAHGVTRSFEDGKLHKGDIVKIKGVLGEFKVQWIDEFEDVTRPKEITVIGGASGRNAWHTYTLDRVKLKPVKRPRRSES
jgi:hypothetical protein